MRLVGKQAQPPQTGPPFPVARHCLSAVSVACHAIAREYRVTGVEFRIQKRMLKSMGKFYDIMNQHGRHMPQSASWDCLECVQTFLQMRNALGQHYRGRSPPLLLFDVAFKSHFTWQLAEFRGSRSQGGQIRCVRHGGQEGDTAPCQKMALDLVLAFAAALARHLREKNKP